MNAAQCQGWPLTTRGQSLGSSRACGVLSASCNLLHSCLSPSPSASTRHRLPFPQLPRTSFGCEHYSFLHLLVVKALTTSSMIMG